MSMSDTKSNYIVTTTALTKKYKNVKAIDNISIQIAEGAVYGLIGQNGAGKTTLMKTICGLISPTSGNFSFMGKEGSRVKEVLTYMGILIEDPGLYLSMSAYENMKIKCIAEGVYSRQYVEELLETVGLGKTGGKKVGKFSMGMKKRLGIALSLAGSPKLLVFDEPMNGLDPQGFAQMRDIIHRLNQEKGITILISSHLLDELSKVATHYGIIHEGRLIKQDTREGLQESCNGVGLEEYYLNLIAGRVS